MTVVRCAVTNDGVLLWWCLGCNEPHHVPITGSTAWGWNGSLTEPTLHPSVLVLRSALHPRCHSHVRDGKQHYCADCEHKLANQTVEIPSWGQAVAA